MRQTTETAFIWSGIVEKGDLGSHSVAKVCLILYEGVIYL